jgi:hypothetical protein
MLYQLHLAIHFSHWYTENVNEVHQYKYISTDVAFIQKDYNDECNKLASKNDFLYVRHNNEKAWYKYFTQFRMWINKICILFWSVAGRVFIFAVEGSPNINTATRTTIVSESSWWEMNKMNHGEKTINDNQDAKRKIDMTEKILIRFNIALMLKMYKRKKKFIN